MKLSRIAFQREVPTPLTPSFSRTNWQASFDDQLYAIDRQGDTVAITHRESGRTFLYPWAHVAGCEADLLPSPPAKVTTTAPPPVAARKGAK